MADGIRLGDLNEILTGSVDIWKWNDGAGRREILFRTYSIESCGIPDRLLDIKVCGLGIYLESGMNYVSVELK